MRKTLVFTLFCLFFVLPVLNAATFSNPIDKRDFDDVLYTKGMAFIKGKIGGTIVKKEISDCPYERCSKPKNSVAHIDADGKKKIFYVHIPDYKKGVKFLRLSMEKGNTKAARALFEFLSKRVDYKESSPNEYLVKRMEKELGISFKEYMKLLKRSLYVAADEDCALYGEVYFFDKKRAEAMKKECVKERF